MDWLQKLLCRLFGYRCPLSIELNGDSILNGYGVDITPVQRIQAARPWWTLDDRCINGLRLQKLMLTFADVPHNSRVTVIALGANDGFGLVPPDEYRADLLEAVRISRECGSTPVFTGLPGMPLGRFPVEWTGQPGRPERGDARHRHATGHYRTPAGMRTFGVTKT